MKDTHVLHNDRIVLDETARRAEYDDTTVSRVGDGIVSDDAVGTTETDTVGPFLEHVRTTRANIVVLNGGAGAGECAFSDVKTRPGAGII